MQNKLTIIFKCTKRPKGIRRALTAIRRQTDPDYQLLCLIDEKGRGMGWSNRNLMHTKQNITGDYIYTYEDDDEMIYDDFVKDLKKITSNRTVQHDLILVRAYIKDELYPKEETWLKEPQPAKIGTPCFVSANRIYQEYIHYADVDGASDWEYISKVWEKPNLKVYWWNEIVNKSFRMDKKLETDDEVDFGAILDEFDVPEKDRIYGNWEF